MDASGNIFGTSTHSDAPGDSYGTVFEFNTTSNALTVVDYLASIGGFYPASGLTMDPSCNMLGLTSS